MIRNLLFSLPFAVMGVAMLWVFELHELRPHSDTMPDDLPEFSVFIHEDSTTAGRLYFDLSSVFQPDGNYMIELDRSTGNVLMAKRFASFGMKFERHSDDLMSYYEYPMRVWNAQSNHRLSGGIRYHTGGVMRVMDNDYRVIETIADGNRIDSHDLVLLEDGSWLYFEVDVRPLDRSQSTITCLLDCALLGQSVARLYPDGTEAVVWSALDFYEQRDFVMDDVFELNHNILYDVIHVNSVTPTPEGNLIISMRHPNEVMVITEDGNLIWRSRDYRIVNDDGFAHQHDAQILPDGNLLLFDNGNGLRDYSRAVEYAVDHERQTLTHVWEYVTDDRHFAPNRGGVQRLDNESTLINFVDGGIVEVDQHGEIMMSISVSDNFASYQARIYP